jgi:hypothetical protein
MPTHSQRRVVLRFDPDVPLRLLDLQLHRIPRDPLERKYKSPHSMCPSNQIPSNNEHLPHRLVNHTHLLRTLFQELVDLPTHSQRHIELGIRSST